MRFLYFLIGVGVGFVFIKYNKWLTEHSGVRLPSVENFLGPGSMYSLWKLAGLILMIAGIYILFGGFGL